MNQTPNYQLNQWDAGDRVLRTDFNADNAKIDAALAEEKAAREAATAALACKLENCKIVHRTYIGTGTYGSDNPCRIDFNGKTPLMVVLFGNKSKIVVGMPGCYDVHFSSSFITSWRDTGFSWYCYGNSPGDQFNINGTTYHYFLIYDE